MVVMEGVAVDVGDGVTEGVDDSASDGDAAAGGGVMDGPTVWLASAAMVCAAAVKTGPGSVVGAVLNGRLQASVANPIATTKRVPRMNFGIIPPMSNICIISFLLKYETASSAKAVL